MPEPAPEASKGQNKSNLRAVGVVGGATILSRILGLIRDMVFAALFPRMATDAFSIAFTIPNLLRRLLAEGIISTAFVPVFTSVEEREHDEKLRTYGAVLGTFFAVLVGVTAAGILLSPWLVRLFALGFKGDTLQLAIVLTQVMFPFLLLVGLASFWIAILHTRKHFAAPALGPVLLNVGIIGCAFGLYRFFPGQYSIAAMAIGVLVGGLFQLILQILTLVRQGTRLRPRWEPKHPAIKEISLLMAPTLLGLGVYQINMLLSRTLASLLPKGSITYIYLSDRLMELPLGIIAVAFATVNLPTLSKQAEHKDWGSFRSTLMGGVRNVLFFCIPAAFGLFALREPVIMTLFQRGRFTLHDVAQCAHIFIPAAFGLIFIATLRNLTPGFYAYKDTKTPVKIAFWSLLINASLSGLFAFLLKMDAQGLTLANACSAAFSAGLSLWYLNRQLEFEGADLAFFWTLLPKLLFAGFVMGTGLWWASGAIPWVKLHVFVKLLALGVLVVAGASVYFALTWTLKIPEARSALDRILRIAKKLRRN